MTEVHLQPGDDELLAMCSDAPNQDGSGTSLQNGGAGTAPLQNGGLLPMDVGEVLANPFNFNMAGAVMNVSNSEVQFGPKIVATPSPDCSQVPVINVKGAYVNRVLCYFYIWRFHKYIRNTRIELQLDIILYAAILF